MADMEKVYDDLIIINLYDFSKRRFFVCASVVDTIGSEKNKMFVSWKHEKLIGILP